MSKQEQQEDQTTEQARWMLEGSHGTARDEDAAVALLEAKVKDGDAEAMWMLGVCCEFGMGIAQDAERAEQLYERAADKGNETAKLLTGKLKNNNGRGCTEMNLGCEQEKSQRTNNQEARQKFFGTTVVANRETMRALGSKDIVLDAADACASHDIGPQL